MTSSPSITLRRYVQVLERVSRGEVQSLDALKGLDNRVARELLRAGLISDNANISKFEESLYAGALLAITPDGIAALESWTAMLKAKSPWQKVLSILEKFFWITVGAIATSIPKLFG